MVVAWIFFAVLAFVFALCSYFIGLQVTAIAASMTLAALFYVVSCYQRRQLNVTVSLYAGIDCIVFLLLAVIFIIA